MMRRFLPLGLFLVFALFAAIPLWQGRGAPLPPDVMTGQPVPLAPVDGLPDTLLRDGTVLVNFFASWCAPCADEQPLLQRIADETGVAVAGIVYKDRRDAIADWLARHGNPFTVIGYDPQGRAAIDWGVYGVPETFLVRDGVIRWRHVGPLDADTYTKKLLPLLRGGGVQ